MNNILFSILLSQLMRNLLTCLDGDEAKLVDNRSMCKTISL